MCLTVKHPCPFYFYDLSVALFFSPTVERRLDGRFNFRFTTSYGQCRAHGQITCKGQFIFAMRWTPLHREVDSKQL